MLLIQADYDRLETLSDESTLVSPSFIVLEDYVFTVKDGDIFTYELRDKKLKPYNHIHIKDQEVLAVATDGENRYLHIRKDFMPFVKKDIFFLKKNLLNNGISGMIPLADETCRMDNYRAMTLMNSYITLLATNPSGKTMVDNLELEQQTKDLPRLLIDSNIGVSLHSDEGQVIVSYGLMNESQRQYRSLRHEKSWQVAKTKRNPKEQANMRVNLLFRMVQENITDVFVKGDKQKTWYARSIDGALLQASQALSNKLSKEESSHEI